MIASPGRRDDLAYALGLVLGLLALVVFGFAELRETKYLSSNDFSGIWAGPRALLAGDDPYDAATWRFGSSMTYQGQGPVTLVYGYPGPVLVALLPLAALPLAIASGLWTFGGLALAVLGLRALLRATIPGLPLAHTLAAITLTFSQPAIFTFYNGQWGFLLVAALCGLVLAFRAGSPVLAGVSLALLGAKPHLFLIALPAVARAALRRGLARALVVAAAIVGTLFGVSLALAPGWVGPYLEHVAWARIPERAQATALPTALRDLFGPAGLVVAALVLFAAIAIALRYEPRGEAGLAVWLAISPLFAPYAWSYDQLVLLVPLVVAAGVAARRSPARARTLVAIGAFALVVVATVLDGVFAAERRSESYNAFVAATVVILVIAGTWSERRARL